MKGYTTNSWDLQDQTIRSKSSISRVVQKVVDMWDISMHAITIVSE